MQRSARRPRPGSVLWIALAAAGASCTILGGLDKTYEQCGPGEEPSEEGCREAGFGGGTTSTTSTTTAQGGAASCSGKPLTCDGVCVDPATDPDHCGGCDPWCLTGASCASGQCSACPGSAVTCADACVDTDTDPDHCGDCTTTCPVDAACALGQCSCTKTLCGCTAGDDACTEECVDLQTSARHCNVCGHACGANEVCVDGTCECPADRATCTSGCADLDTDLANCGKCENACGAQKACIDGACVPAEEVEPAVLVTSLAVDAEAVYWTETNESDLPHGAVRKKLHDGSPAVTLASDENAPEHIALDGKGNVYWVSAGMTGDDVRTVPTSGGAKATLAETGTDVSGLVSDGTTVFWSAIDLGSAWRKGLAPGSTAEEIANGQTTIRSLTMDHKHLFWASMNGGWVAQMRKTGGAVTEVVGHKDEDPKEVAVSATTVYWLGGYGGVGKVPINGGTAVFRPQTPASVGVLRFDASGLYWVDKDADRVHRAVPDLGRVLVVARVPDLFGPLAIGATHIYFSSLNAIHRVPRPAH